MLRLKHRLRPGFNHPGHMPAHMASPLSSGHLVPDDASRHSRSDRAPFRREQSHQDLSALSTKKLILPFTRNMVIWSFSTMHSAFLIQNDWMPRSVCDASWIAWRHASSKLVGDWAITSMLRMIDIVVSSSGGPWPQLPPVVSIPRGLWRLSAGSSAMGTVLRR